MSLQQIRSLLPPRFWQCVIVLIVFASCNAGYYVGKAYTDYMNEGWYSVTSDEEAANPLSIIGTISSIICIAVLFLRIPRKIPPLVLIILPTQAWLVFSSLWSNTIAAALILAIKAVIYANALDCALSELDSRKAIRAFTWAIAIILLISLVLCIMDPIFRMSIGADGWRGLFPQKNRLSSFCLFSGILLFLSVRFSPILSSATLILSLVMLAMSQGKAAMGILLVAIVVIFCTSLIWRGRRDIRPTLITLCMSFFVLFLITAAIVIYQIDQGVVTFTGRAKIWSWFLRDLGGNLIIGMGGLTAPVDPQFVGRAAANGIPPTSDSSYVMMLYNGGVIGVIIFLGTAVGICISSVKKNNNLLLYCVVSVFCYVAFAATESDTRFFSYYSTYVVLALYVIGGKIRQGEVVLKAPVKIV